MKRTVVFILAFLLFGAGCGKNTSTSADNVTVATNKTVADASPVKGVTITDPKIVATVPAEQLGKVAVSSAGLIALTTGKIVAMNIQNPAQPIITGTWDSVYETDAAAMGTKLGFVIDHGYFTTVDFTDANKPVYTPSTSDSSWDVWKMTVRGSMVYAVSGYGGVGIMDASKLNDPQTIGFVPDLRFPESMDVSGKHLYILDHYKGFLAVNIENPASPVEVGRWNDPRFGHSDTKNLAVSGRYAFITTTSSGLTVVDLIDPSHPTEVAHLTSLTSPESVAVAGGYVFIADGSAGLRIIDVHQADKPTIIATVPMKRSADDVAVLGKYAYVADPEAGLTVVELASDSLALPNDEPVRSCEKALSGYAYSEEQEKCVSVTVHDCGTAVGYTTEADCTARQGGTSAIPSNVDTDADSDGIPDIQKAFYGTDPKSSDTDHDGHNDREEIINNYNPLGSGKSTVSFINGYCQRYMVAGGVMGIEEGKSLPQTQRDEICSLTQSLWKDGNPPNLLDADGIISMNPVATICEQYYDQKNDPDAREKTLVCNNEAYTLLYWFYKPGPTISTL